MSWSKKRLKNANLYLILDTAVLSYERLFVQFKAAVRAGVDIVQLRDKNGSARDILDFCHAACRISKGKTLFIVNDRVDIALLAKADGVHLGQQDIGCHQARHMMGPKAILGVSCQSLEHLRQAQAQGSDYIGFGSVFKTKTKPDRQPMDLRLLKSAMIKTKIPVFAIGGISQNNAGQLVDLGVKRLAVCRDILLAKDAGQVVRNFKEILRG